MKIKDVIDVIEKERECVRRNHECTCDRDCGKCDLLMETEKILDAYEDVIVTYNTLERLRRRNAP